MKSIISSACLTKIIKREWGINLLTDVIVDANFQQTDKFYPSEISNNAIDYEKGCYVGQEVVSRMKHRQLNKNLVRVFKKIILIEDFLEKRIENFEILSEYEDY